MKPWQDRCADIIEFLEQQFPETQYRITFRKDKTQGWVFIVESVRRDKGSHDGAAVSWFMETGDDLEKLPETMMVKAREKVIEWAEAGMADVRKKYEELEKARNELDKRLNAKKNLDNCTKEVS
jgi:hypothetical protein